jgi:glycosyltransferase involved in cell wall biosynthesis
LNNLKILHTPKNVGCNASSLAKTERRLGLDSHSIILIGSRFKFDADEILWEQGENPCKLEYYRWKLLLRLIFGYNIIHFNFGTTIMPDYCPLKQPWKARKVPRFLWTVYRLYSNFFTLKDLLFLRLLGKKIIVTFQGSDVRQNDFCRENFEITHSKNIEYDYNEKFVDEARRKKIRAFAKYADALFAVNPDLLHILPPKAKFVPYAHVDPNEWTPSFPDFSDNHIPVVLHAPSDRRIKGTDLIFKAVEKLKSEGVDFELLLIENLPYEEAKKAYAKADILIDQLFVGWYGGLAVELMALGKPALCYIREGDLKFIPEDMRKDMPIVNVSANTIYNKLKYFLTDGKGELEELGKKSRHYVEKWHNPLKIAEIMKNTYQKI